jgi:hypothetical protein
MMAIIGRNWQLDGLKIRRRKCKLVVTDFIQAIEDVVH